MIFDLFDILADQIEDCLRHWGASDLRRVVRVCFMCGSRNVVGHCC